MNVWKLFCVLAIGVVMALGCGVDDADDLGSTTQAETQCTNGDCPPPPGCTNGDCPPPPGCTNGDCPPNTTDACCIDIDTTQRLCCAQGGTEISCRLSTLPDHQVIHDVLMQATTKCKWKIKCEKVKKCYTYNKCSGKCGKCNKCTKVTTCVMVTKCKPVKECKTIYCAPDWWPAGASDVIWPPGSDCDFWSSIKICPTKNKCKKWWWKKGCQS